MATRKDLLQLQNNILGLSASDEPIKKTGQNTVSKLRSENGTALFSNSKNVTITFHIAFDKVPLIQLTMWETGNNPACKVSATKTKFTIKFASNWTGEVDRVASERP